MRNPIRDFTGKNAQRGTSLWEVMVATAVAIIGTSFARIQDVGHLAQWPDAGTSHGVRAADRLIDVAIDRYSRNAGPTTRQLLTFAQHPSRESLNAILDGPFIARLKTSEEMRALAGNSEFRELIRNSQTTNPRSSKQSLWCGFTD